MLTACYLLNRGSCKTFDPKLKTLGERGIECIFVGYAEHSKAYRFYVIEPNDSVAINSIIESRDAIFDEHIFSSVPRPSQRSLVKGTKDSGGSVVSERVTDEIVQQSEPHMRISKRDEVSDQHPYCFNVEDDPKTFDEAMKSQDVAFWKEAINDEMDSIISNNTWVLTDLPPGCRPLGCKWIFKESRSLIIHQMDVKTAFLNGELEEEVYMNQPLGFILSGNENKVCKLIKSMYGLRQAPKQWHQKFDEVVLSNGYLLNQADKCVYSKFDASGKGVIICLYVDDMLIFGTDQVQVDLTKEFLSSRFSMKDMGEADVILGIRIKHESNGIAISQSHYIGKVLKKFNYSDCTRVSTPLDTCEKLMPNRGLAVSQLEYSRVIGCLMYVMTCTRPDIAFAVDKLSRYTSNPGTQHWQAIQRVLKYLKKTMDYKLVYSGYPSVLEGYTDATLAAAGKEAKYAATLAKAYSQMYNGKSRHLGVRHSMIRELITNGVVSIEFVRSQQNLADHLTKGLARDLVIKSVKGMGLKSNQVAEC
ncbi:zinc finger, CCHC-type containing protein [Tanacetum coccineum]